MKALESSAARSEDVATIGDIMPAEVEEGVEEDAE
jgi:hypothetical protein